MKTNPNLTFVKTMLVLSAFFTALMIPLNASQNTKGAVKPYPLKVCLVTDNDLGSMGDERSFVYEGQEIKICCKPCERKFLRNPARFLEKLALLSKK